MVDKGVLINLKIITKRFGELENSPYLRIVTLKQQVMYVKLQNNIINLDLIKKVTRSEEHTSELQSH